jgi:Uma2 family endonuclease
VTVTCSPDEHDPLIIKHPTLVVEVLSPGTAATDRREKMVKYRNIPSLLCYLIVYQDERKLERHWRAATGDPWEFELLLETLNSRITIPGLDVELTFDEVYEGVHFESES